MTEVVKATKKHEFSLDDIERFSPDSTFTLEKTEDVVTFVEWKENFRLKSDPGLTIKFTDGRTMIVVSSELKKVD